MTKIAITKFTGRQTSNCLLFLFTKGFAMSHYYVDALDTFADLATYVHDEHYYWDASDPDNIRAAREYFDTELGFLGNSDKHDLKEAWDAAINDCRNTKLLFNVIKVLKDKYDKPIDESNRNVPHSNQGE
jgi:hypothetical protein